MISAAFASAAGEAAHHGPFYAQAEFWVAAAFVVVVGLAIRPVLRAVFAGLDTRAAQIKAKLDEARKLREDAQALLADYQRKQRDALQEAAAIVAHAEQEVERLKRTSAEALEEAVKRREQQALDRIAQAEQAALAEVRNLAVDIAVKTAGKLIADNLAADKAGALIDNAIKAVGQKLH